MLTSLRNSEIKNITKIIIIIQPLYYFFCFSVYNNFFCFWGLCLCLCTPDTPGLMISSFSLKDTCELLLFLLGLWMSRLPSSMVRVDMRLLWAVLNSVRFCMRISALSLGSLSFLCGTLKMSLSGYTQGWKHTSSSVSSSGKPSSPFNSSSSTPLSPAVVLGCVCGFSLSVYTRVDAPNDMVESMGTCWGLWDSRRILPKKVPWARKWRICQVFQQLLMSTDFGETRSWNNNIKQNELKRLSQLTYAMCYCLVIFVIEPKNRTAKFMHRKPQDSYSWLWGV